jgi:hypothetical protein
MSGTFLRGSLTFTAALAAVVGGFVHSGRAEPDGPAPATQRADATITDALEKLRADGTSAAITVLPIRLAGSASSKVAEVLAMMLERAGMTELSVATEEFDPPEDFKPDELAQKLAAFVLDHPQPGDFIVSSDVVGTPAEGASDVSSVIVSSEGEVVWIDHQAKGDADFDRIHPRDPMQCCLLISERLRSAFALAEPAPGAAADGRITAEWKRNSGIPERAELAEIQARADTFRTRAAEASLVVYPTRFEKRLNAESASHLAELLNQSHLTKASTTKARPKIPIVTDSNEQAVLWTMARKFSEAVKRDPPDADYALYADYLIADKVHGVHFVVCDRNGELVIVDFQNDHHADFQAINPRTQEDCDRLVAERLRKYCR